MIIAANHKTQRNKLIVENDWDREKNFVIIGDDVWIGAGSKIIKGARIDSGVVIGAMSLVNSYIPEWSVAFGIPARVVKSRT